MKYNRQRVKLYSNYYNRRIKGLKSRSKDKAKHVGFTNVVARVSNNQQNANLIQGILNAHVPGAVQGWAGCAFEIMTGQALLAKTRAAYDLPQTSKLVGVTITAYTSQDTTTLIAYKQDTTAPYRVITGTGRIRTYFKFNTDTNNNTILPNHIVFIGEMDTTFKLKLYYKDEAIKSSL